VSASVPRWLEGKSAVVTGASRGIGREIALTLARAGANVLVNFFATHRDEAAAVVAEVEGMGGGALAHLCDVRDAAGVSNMMKAAVDAFGSLDVLVNNAGVTRDVFLPFLKEADWDEVLDVNLKGAFLCTKAAARVMTHRKSGRIINISSVAGLAGDLKRAGYSASKAGLIGLTRAAARDLAAFNITVNAVAPGVIETEFLKDTPIATRERLTDLIPMRRFGVPADVAGVVLFLASGWADYITGQVFVVDGGLHM
jgi:3-oxoacyl-[acyl-carrier protein] reductase